MLFPIINRHQDLVSASLEHVYYFSVKIDDIMIKSLIRIMIRESKKWIRQGIHQGGNLNHALLNRYNCTNLLVLCKKLFSPSSKNKKNTTLKKFLIFFQKKVFLIFQRVELSSLKPEKTKITHNKGLLLNLFA